MVRKETRVVAVLDPIEVLFVHVTMSLRRLDAVGTSQGIEKKRGIGSLNRNEEVRVAAIKGKADVITELLENGERSVKN